MPDEILELVGTLIKQEDVNSVYHYIEDYTFWRMVVAEQVRLKQHAVFHALPDSTRVVVNAFR
jgi:hypothetical protein